jgi:hypothetical protein
MNVSLDPRPLAAQAVGLAVEATRLPIALLERVTGEEARATWGPVRVVNAVDAAVLDAAGRLLDDGRLTARATLLRKSVERATEADELKAQAEATRRQADAEFDERRQRATEQKLTAKERAEEERQRIEAAAAAEERSVRERAAQREKQLDKRDTERQRTVARQERAAGRVKVTAERKALAAEREAIAAESQAIELDDAVADARARRKARNGATR